MEEVAIPDGDEEANLSSPVRAPFYPNACL